MHATPETDATATGDGLTDVIDRAASVVLGKRHVIRLALSCLLARGHLLIEAVPGVGKTTLAHALAHVLHLQYRRIQFTSDLLPADVLGASIFERESSTFRFHPGPVFAELVLRDEINRAPPKTQSALLEAMKEGQVTIEGKTRALPDPFFVIATQNPREQAGTYPLPESQLDRFLMCLSLGFPDTKAERELLSVHDRRHLIRDMQAVLDPARLRDLQARAETIHLAPAIPDYVQALLAASRDGDRFVAGLSPRAGLSLIASARGWALLAERDYVLPEDVQTVLGPVVDHRLQSLDSGDRGRPGERLQAEVPLP